MRLLQVLRSNHVDHVCTLNPPFRAFTNVECQLAASHEEDRKRGHVLLVVYYKPLNFCAQGICNCSLIDLVPSAVSLDSAIPLSCNCASDARNVSSIRLVLKASKGSLRVGAASRQSDKQHICVAQTQTICANRRRSTHHA